MQNPPLISSSSPKTWWEGTMCLTRAHPWRWSWPWVHSESGNRHDEAILWMVCCLEWPPSPVDDCHMTWSVDAFEFKSVASTSSRYVFESRHQRAHHNISDELEPSLTTLTFVLRDLAHLTRWSATERWKTYSKSTGVTGGTFGRTQDESFGLGGWCRQSHDRVTSKRFEQAIDDHPISWKTKQEHRETKRGTLDCHILSWRWIMVTEALRSEVRTKIYRLSRDHLKRRRCV